MCYQRTIMSSLFFPLMLEKFNFSNNVTSCIFLIGLTNSVENNLRFSYCNISKKGRLCKIREREICEYKNLIECFLKQQILVSLKIVGIMVRMKIDLSTSLSFYSLTLGLIQLYFLQI